MAFLEGVVIGVSVAAPVGPIGLLCIRRTLTGGMRAGLQSGLGAATADFLFAIVAAAGISIVRLPWLDTAGAAVLLWMAFRLWRSPSAPAEAARDGGYWSTLLLTLANPMTIVAFAAVCSRSASAPLGILAGSGLWWVGLCGLVSRFRHRVGPQSLLWVNRVAGVVIAIFAVRLLWR